MSRYLKLIKELKTKIRFARHVERRGFVSGMGCHMGEREKENGNQLEGKKVNEKGGDPSE